VTRLGMGTPKFILGVRDAVGAAVDYGLASIEHGEEWSEAIPLATVTQARRAALEETDRSNLSNEQRTELLLRYVAGHQRLSVFVQISIALSSLLGRLLALVVETYTREVACKACSREQHRAEVVQCVLAGGAVDVSLAMTWRPSTSEFSLPERAPPLNRTGRFPMLDKCESPKQHACRAEEPLGHTSELR
jgi:hypothetical protein